MGFPLDGGYSANWWVPIEFGKLKVYLPNFKWRKRAIRYHDLHHIVTGYECNPNGEIEIATWEFAAGHFPHYLATLFCLPLVITGAVLLPKRTFAAFLHGRNSTTLYSTTITDDLLDIKIHTLRERMLPIIKPKPSFQDGAAYCLLVSMSLLLTLSPFVVGILVFCTTRL